MKSCGGCPAAVKDWRRTSGFTSGESTSRKFMALGLRVEGFLGLFRRRTPSSRLGGDEFLTVEALSLEFPDSLVAVPCAAGRETVDGVVV